MNSITHNNFQDILIFFLYHVIFHFMLVVILYPQFGILFIILFFIMFHNHEILIPTENFMSEKYI